MTPGRLAQIQGLLTGPDSRWDKQAIGELLQALRDKDAQIEVMTAEVNAYREFINMEWSRLQALRTGDQGGRNEG